MGQYTTIKTTHYELVRLTRDAKHFAKTADKGAVTYITFVDGTKDGEDIFIDAAVKRGADLMAGLLKGDIVNVTGTVEFSTNPVTGKLVGKIYDAKVSTSVKLKERATQATPTLNTTADDGQALAFD